ncbi:MAG: hypothetical protein HY606_00450 [Planctomycetes bacterium]|nr:hypothetical protein [Planctomycetota bacterium]
MSNRKILLILILAKLSLVIRCNLIALGILFVADIFIPLSNIFFVTAIGFVSVSVLLFIEDRKILYHCDKVSDSKDLLTTLYSVNNASGNIFIHKLLDRLSLYKTTSFLKIRIIHEIGFVVLMILVNIALSGLVHTEVSGNSLQIGRGFESVQSNIKDIERLMNLLKPGESEDLRNELGSVMESARNLKQVSEIDNILDQLDRIRSGFDKGYSNADSYVAESLKDSLGTVSGLLKRDGFRYELLLRSTDEKVKSDVRNLDLTRSDLNIVSESSDSNIEIPGDVVSLKFPLKYKAALKNYFERSEQ